MKMNVEQAETMFGFDPTKVGIRYRGWWIVEDIEQEEEIAKARIGDLCVRARDGAGNHICTDSVKIPNFVGTAQDSFDYTNRYYYYRPLKEAMDNA